MLKRILIGLALMAFAGMGCTTYVRPAPPVSRVEVKPAKPYKSAVWVPGHWKWKNRRAGYVWVPGHWRRA